MNAPNRPRGRPVASVDPAFAAWMERMGYPHSRSGQGYGQLSGYLRRCGLDVSPLDCRRASSSPPPAEWTGAVELPPADPVGDHRQILWDALAASEWPKDAHGHPVGGWATVARKLGKTRQVWSNLANGWPVTKQKAERYARLLLEYEHNQEKP